MSPIMAGRESKSCDLGEVPGDMNLNWNWFSVAQKVEEK